LFSQSDTSNIKSDYLETNDSNKWALSSTIYLSLAGIDGVIIDGSHTIPIEANFSDILDKLGFAAMFHGEMAKGRWILMTDLFYIKLKKGGSLTRNNVPVQLELEETIFELGGGFELIKNPNFNLDLLAGARFFYLCNTVKDEDELLLEKKLDFIDPYVGLRYLLQLKKWENRIRFDVGGFDIGSELSWKFNVLLGYELNQKSTIYAGYQAYDVNYKKGDFNYDVLTSGPILGLKLNF